MSHGVPVRRTVTVIIDVDPFIMAHDGVGGTPWAIHELAATWNAQTGAWSWYWRGVPSTLSGTRKPGALMTVVETCRQKPRPDDWQRITELVAQMPTSQPLDDLA